MKEIWPAMWLLPLFAVTTSAYRILAFLPTPGLSQHNIFAPILHHLAKNGHSVVYLTPVPPSLKHPNLEIRQIPQYADEFQDALDLLALGKASAPVGTHMLHYASEATANLSYGSYEAQKIIHSENERFDAVIMESYFVQYPVSALLHKFSCPAIEVSTLGDFSWINELSGLPNNPAFQIDFLSEFTDDMNFLERLVNFYITWSTIVVSYYHLWRGQALMDLYFNYRGSESRPSIFQLISNRSLILINQDSVLGYPVPTSPHVKLIGGVNILPRQPLPQSLKEVMDSASNGVIYFSMGSNLNTSEIMNSSFGRSFIQVFSQLPQRIVMKWESSKAPGNLPSNIFTKLKWLPQQDILAHKNCRLFITHGGYLSLTEAVHYGVPVLGVPFFGDQPKNLVQVEAAGFGLKLNFDNVSIESVRWAVGELLNNSRYLKEAERRSAIIKKRRWTALDEALYWIIHAIEYPNSLTPRSAFLTFGQLHNLDIYLFLMIIVTLFIGLIRKIFNIMRSWSAVKTKRKKEKLK